MRWAREVALVTLCLVLASVPAGALPTPPSGPFVQHGPIVITSNADFTTANGVRNGSGTVSDPYVISGWGFGTATTGIRIEGPNVTAAFLIKDNSFTNANGIVVKNTPAPGIIQNNQFRLRGIGVLAQNADPLIKDNSFMGDTSVAPEGRGVELQTSNARVESNAFIFLKYAIKAERGSPSLLCNDIHDDVVQAGVYMRFTTNATVSCNIFTQCHMGVYVFSAIGPVIANNSIDACLGGIHVDTTKDATVANNTIRFSKDVQLKVETVSGNITGNLIVNGRADGALVWNSPVLFANNTIHNNVGVGVRFDRTGGNASANVVTHNSVGIRLSSGAVVGLHANLLLNNSVGFDIPYESRQVFVDMSANVVNGFNVDGTVNASQKAFFYHAANVSIQGQVFDSGFSAGLFGAISAQGQIVLYDVDTAEVNATVVSHGQVGVGIVNSFNVNVNDSLVVSNLIGIKAEVKTNPGPVPNCVIGVKRTNVTIPVDPVATVGIQTNGCLALVANVSVSVVDIGIKADGAAGLFLSNSTVFNTRIGLDVAGVPNMTNVSGNTLVDNRIGARLSGTVGAFSDNVVLRNADVGVRLENAARLELERNNISLNGAGLIDMEVCGGPLTCSSIDARGNVFYANEGDGARIHGASEWRGDKAIGNEEDGFQLGSTEMRNVVAVANEGDGARITGRFEVQDSDFRLNDEDGLDVTGEGELRDSNFTHNEDAGLRVDATYVTALRLNVSFNFDGIIATDDDTAGAGGVPSLPTAGGLLGLVWAGTSDGPLGPLDVHLSTFLGNQRDAIRAGWALVNATHNYFGSPTGPSVNVADTVGAFDNGVSPMVRFAPYYTDPEMTTTGPAPFL